ncbi:N-acyl homoserine lactonase family protein [Diaphorobacter aerolatus]|uniref:N-acyl homoserine lactonase family protein n=1 Tax=Diaphorobacter aerolatus TaxID=1288495 RepID=A0A7H0GKS3_9BURK|nr:N-acyl homoserine lactonase family protein [Diaphorobacter aerolatus]QNP48889.1 N-acyl homoserine lactonase family protein [Diaphorobacter aerolatus]
MASGSIDSYEVYAIKYASVERARQSNFLEPVDGDPDAPMPLDFFVWLVRGGDQLLLIDTGFSRVSALARNRSFVQEPVAALAALGVQASDVKHVVLTHLHYDHAGNVNQFPDATVWLQEREIAYATGKCMCDRKQNHFFALDDIAVVLKRLYEGEVRLIDGAHAFAPSIEFHRVGGHTDGLQIVRVMTTKGWVVLASDAAHYYENLARMNPFPAIFSKADMMTGYGLIRQLADGDANIIPGHDPRVCERFERLDIPGSSIHRIA